MSAEISSWVKSENNFIARLAGGKSLYELYTGKKPNPVQHYAKEALNTLGKIGATVGKVVAVAVLSELVPSQNIEYNLIKGIVSVLGKSTNPLAHSAIRISERVISGVGAALRQ